MNTFSNENECVIIKEIKACSGCKVSQPQSEFHRNTKTKDGLQYRCKTCTYKRVAESQVALRIRAVKFLGERCVRCGFSDMRALQIDHVHGGGHQERKVTAPRTIYNKILDGDPDYQILCANCNWIKRSVENENKGYKSNKKEMSPISLSDGPPRGRK